MAYVDAIQNLASHLIWQDKHNLAGSSIASMVAQSKINVKHLPIFSISNVAFKNAEDLAQIKFDCKIPWAINKEIETD